MPQAFIIDDNRFNTDILASLLQDEGFDSVIVQQPGQIANSLDKLDDVRVVFLDLEMPGLDGFDVLEQLRANATFQNVPIVAHTVHISEIKVAHDAGFDGFIGKPLNADKFPKQLVRILDGKGVWETA
mgnify:CR=1 FL=1